MSKQTAIPFGWEISRGKIAGSVPLHIAGSNPDTTAAQEDVWEGAGGSGTNLEIPHPVAAGIQMELVSSDAADDGAPAGDGARTVKIHYLDANFAEKTETIVLNGTTPVDTVATNIRRVQSMQVMTVGVDGKSAGLITLESTDSAIEYCRIRLGFGISLKGEWTVPLGKKLFISQWSAGAIMATAQLRAEFILKATSELTGELLTDIWAEIDTMRLTAGNHPHKYDVPLVIPATADVKVAVISSAAMEVSTMFEGWYE